MRAPVMTAEEIEDLLRREFPQAFYDGCGLSLERVGYGAVRVRRKFHEEHLRPGGTVSGPTMMELADFAMYVAVFSAIGPQPLAVTTNLSINFLDPDGYEFEIYCQLDQIGDDGRLRPGLGHLRVPG